MSEKNIAEYKRRMGGTVEALKNEFSGLRTGRASAGLLDPIMVDAYGAMTPLNQVAGVTIPEPRMLTVTVWDQSVIKAVEKAIRESDLGLNPIAEGNVLRIPIPELNEQRRIEISKVAGKYAETARISVRNIRRDAMDSAKKDKKSGDLSEDDFHRLGDKIQKMTDSFIAEIDSLLGDKEKEIMQV